MPEKYLLHINSLFIRSALWAGPKSFNLCISLIEIPNRNTHNFERQLLWSVGHVRVQTPTCTPSSLFVRAKLQWMTSVKWQIKKKKNSYPSHDSRKIRCILFTIFIFRYHLYQFHEIAPLVYDSNFVIVELENGIFLQFIFTINLFFSFFFFSSLFLLCVFVLLLKEQQLVREKNIWPGKSFHSHCQY